SRRSENADAHGQPGVPVVRFDPMMAMKMAGLLLALIGVGLTGCGEVATGAGSGAAASGAGGGSPACVPGKVVSCPCLGGGQGIQYCKADGSGFGLCNGCDAGSGGSSGTSGSGGAAGTTSSSSATSSSSTTSGGGGGSPIPCA